MRLSYKREASRVVDRQSLSSSKEMSIYLPVCVVCQGACLDETERVVPFTFEGFNLYATFSLVCDQNKAEVRKVEFKSFCYKDDRIVLELADLERLSEEVWEIAETKKETDPNFTWRLKVNRKATMQLYQKECKDFLSTMSLLMTLYVV